MTMLRELLQPNLRLLAAAICAAGVLHICITLAAPHLTVSPAYERLAAGMPLHKMQLLPPVDPENQALPFMGPEARYAACRFDATNGTVTVSATLPGPGWVLSIFTPSGDNIYSAVAPPVRQLDVFLKISPSENRVVDLPREARAAIQGGDSALGIAAQTGLILVRAPDQGTAYRAANLAQLARAACSYRQNAG